MSMKNSNDIIENRTCDLLACSAGIYDNISPKSAVCIDKVNTLGGSVRTMKKERKIQKF